MSQPTVLPTLRDRLADRAANWLLSAPHAKSRIRAMMIQQANDCDRTTAKRGPNRVNNNKLCDHLLGGVPSTLYLAAVILLLTLISGAPLEPAQSQSIIIDHHHRPHRPLASSNATTNSEQQPVRVQPLAAHFQPASLVLAQNKSINFTHVAVDELTGTIYLGATNWLLQVNGRDLRVEQALRTGPTTSDSSLARDCAPADCLNQLAQVDLHELMPLMVQHQHPAIELSAATPTSHLPSGAAAAAASRPRFGLGATMHTAAGSGNATGSRLGGRPTLMQSAAGLTSVVTTQLPTTTTATGGGGGGGATTQQQQQMQHNNYNKLLAIDQESRSLIVCGSLNQGACRRHQLRNIANFSELIPLPVASNDEHSSTLGLVVRPGVGGVTATPPAPPTANVFYVAATNSRLGPYREMVPAISARSLDWSSRDRSMQIIERSFTDLARVDISYELRDYYLVNYVAAFQHNDFVYFATVQRKSPLRQLEEWGYTTRLARLCLNDLSFQSYTEMTLECSGPAPAGVGSNKQVNYNLLQDAHLMQAGSQLQGQLGLGAGRSSSSSAAVLVGAFAQSKDHTTKSQHKSALCLFAMDKIEQKFQENIDLCYNGTIKSRNMNYIAGSVNDCPARLQATTTTTAGGQQQTSQNYCNEPIKLNGSVALQAQPIASFDQELITSIQSTLAPTSPVNIQQQQQQQRGPLQSPSPRQHQVLIAGTADGRLKRLVLVAGGERTTALEFDSVSLVDDGGSSSEQPSGGDSAVLADLHLMPAVNPQLAHHASGGERHQFALAATAHKLVKMRVNSCKAGRSARQQQQTQQSSGNSSIVDDCLACSQLQDPFCGWCSQSASCTTRDECLQEGWSSSGHKSAAAAAAPVHWTPFDSIRCSNYQPISPKNVPLQADSSSLVIDVNVRLNLKHLQHAGTATNIHHQLAARLAQAQFVCHFDYLSLWTTTSNGTSRPSHLAGATTKATQARMNLHAGTVAIGCPLPVASQRPASLTNAATDHARVRLSVRLASVGHHEHDREEDRQHLEQVLGMRSGRTGSGQDLAQQQQQQVDTQIERDLTLYDCSANTDCRSCLSSGSLGRLWACSWCPLSSKCTFNASHADYGCAAGAVASTTPHSAALHADPSLAQIRGSQLTASLDRAQASVLGLTLERLGQCPSASPAQRTSASDNLLSEDSPQATTSGGATEQVSATGMAKAAVEILLPNSVRRSVHVPLARPIHHFQPREKRVLKLECLLELEGAKARFAARLQDNSLVVCQESFFSYQTEVATQRAQLSVILNDNQVIETTEVIIYKCHLFGVNPPALTSSVFSKAEIASASSPRAHGHHSSAAWASNLSDFLHLLSTSSAAAPSVGGGGQEPPPSRRSSDCSLCLNIDRKYQCSWCAGQCKHAEQCGAQELPASTCPPPRIDSIHPTSGPIAGGTLLTIEGSNLGSNEREIQDKILVGGEPCQLIMYSVSTRIVCKTAPSKIGPQAATVFVGNRAGVTSAHEKFHYKAIHLSDVSPRVGPVSGGTRLTLTGSNLNFGSRIQVFLDEVPCQLDAAFDAALAGGNQLACITGPYPLASNSNTMHIARLTLVIDNSTHELPFPFTYRPDPIITAIEPAESFLAGGRLLLVTGEHLSSPQSVKLVVYHESRPSLSNATSCQKQNDTLITCLTPAFSRSDLLAIEALASQQQQQQQQDLDQQLVGPANDQVKASSSLAHASGGLKLKMAFLMDDVRSVRNLDEYYHHLPHYLAYYEDPTLFRLQPPVLEYREELHVTGENLLLRQLDQDMLITIGAHICPIKSITAQRVVCEPPARIGPIYEQLAETGGGGNRRRASLVERPLLPVVALIGSNLRYDLGHMQYSSSQYLPASPGNSELSSPTELAPPSPNYPADSALDPFYSQAGGGLSIGLQQDISPSASLSPVTALTLGLLGLLVAGLLVAFTFALARFRQSKAQQREYKRIQLQMGSLDCQSPGLATGSGGASFASGLFDKIYLPSMGSMMGGMANEHQAASNQQRQLFANGAHQPRTATIDYIVNQQTNGSGAGTKTKPLYQFFTAGQPQVPNSFPPSPLTDISSLIGSSPAHSQQQQHVVKLNASGQVVNHMAHQQQYNYGVSLPQPPALQANNSTSPSHSSSGSSSGGSSSQQQHNYRGPHNSSARNFSWTQEAPSTIVPYAVIEACNLTLEGKNAIKEYV